MEAHQNVVCTPASKDALNGSLGSPIAVPSSLSRDCRRMHGWRRVHQAAFMAGLKANAKTSAGALVARLTKKWAIMIGISRRCR